MSITVVKHNMIPQCGSYEVRFSDGWPSSVFYWDEGLSRNPRAERLTRSEAREQAYAFVRAESDKEANSREIGGTVDEATTPLGRHQALRRLR